MKTSLALVLASSAVLLASAVGCAASDESVDESESMNTADASAPSADAGAPSTDGSAPSTDAGPPATLCSAIPAGPFQPQLVGRVFQGSEDFAFDGQGHIVGKRGSTIVLLDGQNLAAAPRALADLPGQTYGLRYQSNGNLIAAIPQAGKAVSITPAGVVTDFATGLGTPNGVYPDFDGNVWITEFGGSKVTKVGPDGTKTVVVSGSQLAQAANGVVVDAKRKLLFYTEYQKGNVNRLDLSNPAAVPQRVAQIQGAALDGIVLDTCGNVYAVDQGSSRIFRVKTLPTGGIAGPVELLATFPTNVANAQFGSGPGFDPKKLYVTGNPGSVYTLDLGVEGAPVPTAPAVAPPVEPPTE